MLVNYDWYIVPVLNPDGYEYTVSFKDVHHNQYTLYQTCGMLQKFQNSCIEKSEKVYVRQTKNWVTMAIFQV